MNKQLLDKIYTSIKSAVSGSTNEIHFDFLPDEKLLNKLTVVYELRNSSNENTFDAKEVTKFYELRVKVNAPNLKELDNQSIYIKNRLYKLSIGYISLIDEDLFFDSQLKVWTEFYKYELQA